MTSLVQPTSTQERHGWYSYTWGDTLTVTVDRFHETGRSLYAEVIARHNGRHILRTTKDLLSDTGKGTLARRLAERTGDPTITWEDVVEYVCETSVRQWREGEPPTDIGNRPLREGTKWRLYPIVPEQMPALLFGAGMALKSWIAMAMSMSVQSGVPMLGWLPVKGNVLWCDYEMSVDEVNERMLRLQAGMGLLPGQQLTMRYKYCDRALADLVPELLQEIAEHDIKMIVIDSLIAAVAGSSFTDENIRPLFSALRVLNVSPLIISHVNQQMKRDTTTNNRSTYGNIFIENWVRQMFDIRAGTDGANPRPIVMVNTKWNLMNKLAPVGYEVAFDDEVGDVAIRRRDITTMPDEVATTVPLASRIVELLKRGEMSAAQIAEELGDDEKQVKSRLSDMKKSGRVVNLSRGTWGLPLHDN